MHNEAECSDSISAIISSNQPPSDSRAFEHSKNKTHIGLKCDCLPDCIEVVRFNFLYPFQMSMISYAFS